MATTQSRRTVVDSEVRISLSREAVPSSYGVQEVPEHRLSLSNSSRSITTRSKRWLCVVIPRRLTAIRKSIFTHRTTPASHNPTQENHLVLNEAPDSSHILNPVHLLDETSHTETPQITNDRSDNTADSVKEDENTVRQSLGLVLNATLTGYGGDSSRRMYDVEVATGEASLNPSPALPRPESISSTISNDFGIVQPLFIVAENQGGQGPNFFRATMDTGADLNLMGEEIADRIGGHRIDRTETKSFYGVGNVRCKTIGRLEVVFRIKGFSKWYKAGFHVVATHHASSRYDSLLSKAFVFNAELLQRGPGLLDGAVQDLDVPLP